MVGERSSVEPVFIVDVNAGKLARWLRLIGYDTLLFREQDDGVMVKIALRENRVILTKDSEILKRRLVTGGKIKVIHLESDVTKTQLQQVARTLHLDLQLNPFSRCLECNEPLVERGREDVRNLVPPHVYKTQTHYMQCPLCQRVYWRGTHWQAMCRQIKSLQANN